MDIVIWDFVHRKAVAEFIAKLLKSLYVSKQNNSLRSSENLLTKLPQQPP